MIKPTTKTTRVSAVFLAAVLVAGTIALVSPSFITDAQAFPDYTKFKKSHGKDVSVKYIKCNNINVNINGVSINIGDIPGLLGPDVTAEATEAAASSFGGNNNGPHGSDNKGVVFVCINNNNNGGAGDDDDDDDVRTCEECFEDELSDTAFAALETALGSATGFVVDFSTTDSPGPFTSLQEICEFLELEVGEGIELNGMLQDIVEAIEALPTAGTITDAQFEALEDCIEEALGIDNGPTV